MMRVVRQANKVVGLNYKRENGHLAERFTLLYQQFFLTWN